MQNNPSKTGDHHHHQPAVVSYVHQSTAVNCEESLMYHTGDWNQPPEFPARRRSDTKSHVRGMNTLTDKYAVDVPEDEHSRG